jgi:hypothetical protein
MQALACKIGLGMEHFQQAAARVQQNLRPDRRGAVTWSQRQHDLDVCAGWRIQFGRIAARDNIESRAARKRKVGSGRDVRERAVN